MRALRTNLLARDAKARLILFGSRATGRHRYNSDYDVLILSEIFETLPPDKRWMLVQTNIKPSGYDVVLQPHCYTPLEWQSCSTSLLAQEVSEHGIELTSADARRLGL
ncbi:MAG: hypothetical protein OHK0011_05480 [Turneriella sp.]